SSEELEVHAREDDGIPGERCSGCEKGLVQARTLSCSRHPLRIWDAVVEPERIAIADLDDEDLGGVRVGALLEALCRADHPVVAAFGTGVEVSRVSLGNEPALATRARDGPGGRRCRPEFRT